MSSNRLSREYENKVSEFVKFAVAHAAEFVRSRLQQQEVFSEVLLSMLPPGALDQVDV